MGKTVMNEPIFCNFCKPNKYVNKVPFTFSHPAAVLPLSFIDKKKFSITALTIGSMTPDFEYFINFKQHSIYSHTWFGVFWFDIPISIALFILFNTFVKDQLIDNLPQFLNRRFARFKNLKRIKYNKEKYLIVFTSLFTGIISHLFWDKLTHKSVTLTEEPMDYTFIWDANSMIGAIIIAVMIWKMPESKTTTRHDSFFYWFLLLLTILVVLIIRSDYSTDIRSMGTSSISGLFIGLLLTSIVCRLRYKKQTKLT